MSASIWRINNIDTGGKDLELSALSLWTDAAAVDAGAIVECSHSPISGSIANLTDGDALTTCKWAAQDVSSPGFWIQWTLTAPADAWCARYSAPAQVGFLWNYALGYQASGRWLWAQQGRVVWPGVNLLTAKRVATPRFDSTGGFYASGLSAGTDMFSHAAISGDGVVMLVLQTGSSVGSSAKPNMSVDGGITWSRPSGVLAGGAGFGGCAVSDDGRTLVVAGYGSSGKVNLSKDGGATWTQPAGPVFAGSGFGPCAVSADGMTVVVVSVGTGAAVNLSKDGGVTWTRPATLTVADSRLYGGCDVSSDGSVIAVAGTGSTGRITISRDGGATWSAASVTPGAQDGFCSVAVSGDGQTILAAGRNGVVGQKATVGISYDSGLTWVNASGSVLQNNTFGHCAMSANGKVMAIGGGASSPDQISHLSMDGGITWKPVMGLTTGRMCIGCALSADGATLLIPGYWSNAWTAVITLRDSSYTDNPVVTPLTGVQPFAKGSNPVAAPVRDVRSAPFLDAEFGGRGRIYGTVSIKGTPGNTPVARRVRLLRSRDSYLARETWSKPDGSYSFDNINEQYEYDVLAFDHELSYFSEIANNKKPEFV